MKISANDCKSMMPGIRPGQSFIGHIETDIFSEDQVNWTRLYRNLNDDTWTTYNSTVPLFEGTELGGGETSGKKYRMSANSEEETSSVTNSSQEKRRKTNREASQRARQRQLIYHKDLKERYFQLECANIRLNYEALQLRKERDKLRNTLREHQCILPLETRQEEKKYLEATIKSEMKELETKPLIPSVVQGSSCSLTNQKADEETEDFERHGKPICSPEVAALHFLPTASTDSDLWQGSFKFLATDSPSLDRTRSHTPEPARRASLPVLPQFDRDSEGKPAVPKMAPNVDFGNYSTPLTVLNLQSESDEQEDIQPEYTLMEDVAQQPWIQTPDVPVSPVCDLLRQTKITSPHTFVTASATGSLAMTPVPSTATVDPDEFIAKQQPMHRSGLIPSVDIPGEDLDRNPLAPDLIKPSISAGHSRSQSYPPQTRGPSLLPQSSPSTPPLDSPFSQLPDAARYGQSFQTFFGNLPDIINLTDDGFTTPEPDSLTGIDANIAAIDPASFDDDYLEAVLNILDAKPDIS